MPVSGILSNMTNALFQILNDLCSLSINNEYSLHHKFLPATSAEDWIHVTEINAYKKVCMNLFSLTEDWNNVNFAMGVLIEGKEKNMLLEWISDGDKANNEATKSSYLMSFQKALTKQLFQQRK